MPDSIPEPGSREWLNQRAQAFCEEIGHYGVQCIVVTHELNPIVATAEIHYYSTAPHATAIGLGAFVQHRATRELHDGY